MYQNFDVFLGEICQIKEFVFRESVAKCFIKKRQDENYHGMTKTTKFSDYPVRSELPLCSFRGRIFAFHSSQPQLSARRKFNLHTPKKIRIQNKLNY